MIASEERKHRVLIVDDERANIFALANILRPNYEILVAKDGSTALEVIDENLPDLILLDVIMPGIDGFEVLAKLKASDATRGIPVIFITGRDSVEDEARGISLGAVDYITKPFHNSIVKARVKTHLQTVEYIKTIELLGMIDGMTGLPNRRSFDIHLNREWLRAIRERAPISMLMIDVDMFKRYNDTYGHPQGDVALQSTALILKRMAKRATDFVARWGGEEFAVLLPNTDLPGALDVAEQIRGHVESAIISCSDGRSTTITVSIGAHTLKPEINDLTSDLSVGADKALYTAKSLGRNRVCPYEETAAKLIL